MGHLIRGSKDWPSRESSVGPCTAAATYSLCPANIDYFFLTKIVILAFQYNYISISISLLHPSSLNSYALSISLLFLNPHAQTQNRNLCGTEVVLAHMKWQQKLTGSSYGAGNSYRLVQSWYSAAAMMQLHNTAFYNLKALDCRCSLGPTTLREHIRLDDESVHCCNFQRMNASAHILIF